MTRTLLIAALMMFAASQTPASDTLMMRPLMDQHFQSVGTVPAYAAPPAVTIAPAVVTAPPATYVPPVVQGPTVVPAAPATVVPALPATVGPAAPPRGSCLGCITSHFTQQASPVPVYATPNWTAPNPVLPPLGSTPAYAVPTTYAPTTYAPTTTYYAPAATYVAPVTTYYRAPPASPYYSGFVQPTYFPRGRRP